MCPLTLEGYDPSPRKTVKSSVSLLDEAEDQVSVVPQLV